MLNQICQLFKTETASVRPYMMGHASLRAVIVFIFHFYEAKPFSILMSDSVWSPSRKVQTCLSNIRQQIFSSKDFLNGQLCSFGSQPGGNNDQSTDQDIFIFSFHLATFTLLRVGSYHWFHIIYFLKNDGSTWITGMHNLELVFWWKKCQWLQQKNQSSWGKNRPHRALDVYPGNFGYVWIWVEFVLITRPENSVQNLVSSGWLPSPSSP